MDVGFIGLGNMGAAMASNHCMRGVFHERLLRPPGRAKSPA